MLPPAGDSKAEKWVAEGRRCAAMDLVRRLQSLDQVERIIACVGDEEDMSELAELGVEASIAGADDFHFGQYLWNLIETNDLASIGYFGGASAPLLSAPEIRDMLLRAGESEEPLAIVNNYHSTDWAVVNDASIFEHIQDRLPTDNPIGWVLKHDTGTAVIGLDPGASTRLDIDTPSDLLLSSRHPNLGPFLTDFMTTVEDPQLARVERILDIINKSGSSLALIGRVPSHAWKSLEKKTQIWIRVFSEERGMVASGRLANGEVDSMIARMISWMGVGTFVHQLSDMVDGALWDTRVWLASGREWPSRADRYAADLGWGDQIEDDPLRELVNTLAECEMPVITGGYGVVAGGLYALIESR